MELRCIDYEKGIYEESENDIILCIGIMSAEIIWKSDGTVKDIILRIVEDGCENAVYLEELKSMSSKLTYAMALQNMIEDIEGEYNRIYKELANCIADSPEFLILRKMGIIADKKDGE